jgi:NADH dehydrogenase FAD-containing subunit
MMTDKHINVTNKKVVIIGAGFGGLWVARGLAKIYFAAML